MKRHLSILLALMIALSGMMSGTMGGMHHAAARGLSSEVQDVATAPVAEPQPMHQHAGDHKDHHAPDMAAVAADPAPCVGSGCTTASDDGGCCALMSGQCLMAWFSDATDRMPLLSAIHGGVLAAAAGALHGLGPSAELRPPRA
jgi:hypothetical protein